MILWLTGKSGAGKTTLARELQKVWPCIILDGNEMRNSISLDAGFSREDRTEHNLRVARLARELNKQTNVVVSVIAPVAHTRSIISTNYSDLQWVYIKRTVPARSNHFYEEPTDYPILDNDTLSVADGIVELKKIINEQKADKMPDL